MADDDYALLGIREAGDHMGHDEASHS